MAVRTVVPNSDLAGAFELGQPLPVVEGFEPVTVLAVGEAGYQGFDSNGFATQSRAIVLPEIGNAVPRDIELVSNNFLNYAGTFTTSFNVTIGSATVEAGDLIIIDTSTQEQTDPGVPNTPTGYTQRFSHYTTSPNPWIPRFTRFYRFADGGEENDVVNITIGTSCRLHAKVTVWRNVDPDNPFPVTQAQNHFTGTPDPGAIAQVPAGSVVLSTVASNNASAFNTATDGPGGYSLVGANAPAQSRFFIEYYRVLSVESAEEPSIYGQSFDNWTHVTDALQPAVGSGGGDIALVMVTAVADDTGTPDISASVPEVAPTDEIQRLQANTPGAAFSFNFRGSSTAGLVAGTTAAELETALEGLPTIGAGNVSVTGGPMDEDACEVQFFGALGDQDVPLITSPNDVTITQIQRGTAGFDFTYEWEWNTPTTGSTYTPQVQIWSAVPDNYIAGDAITFTSSNHFPLHTWAGILLVLQGADIADVLGLVTTDSIGEGSRATFQDLTTTIPGSKLFAFVAKAIESHYAGEPPTSSAPQSYTATVAALADAMTLEVWESGAVAAATHSTTDAVWSGSERFTNAVFPVKPAISAGTAGIAETLGDGSDDTWVEFSSVAGSMFEVVELGLDSLPEGRVLTGATISIRHKSPQRNALRAELVGINSDGTIVRGGEKQAGGYIPEPVGEIQTIVAGPWIELQDQPISDFDRIGVALYSTSRAQTLTSHTIHQVTVEVEFIEGGPVVSNVAGPATEGADVTWEYSSTAGLGMVASQVQIIQGFDQSPDDDYETDFFDQFDTVGPASTVFSDTSVYEIYDSAGNAGYGLRRPSAIEVVAEGTATSGSNVCRITASNGTGDEAGDVVSGGMKFLSPITYGQVEFRARASGDPDLQFSPVILLWPKADPERFPDSNNASGDEGEWPAGGELDIIEAFGPSTRGTLNPMESHIHRLKLGATTPYDASDDETLDFNLTGIVGTDWHKYVFTWEPGSLSIDIDDGTYTQTFTTDPAWIPDWPMEVTFQLDAWANGTMSGDVTFDLDYMLVRRKVNQVPAANPLDPSDGEILYDTGKVGGSLTRSLTLDQFPMVAGSKTVAVRAWARLDSGVEVSSPWAFEPTKQTIPQSIVLIWNKVASGWK